LQILAETQSKVEGLQQELKIKMVDVEQKKQETNALINTVEHESGIAKVE
jgi:dynein heavy chain, axonemal